MNRFGGPPFTWADTKGEDVTPEDLYEDWRDWQRHWERERVAAIRERASTDFEDRKAA